MPFLPPQYCYDPNETLYWPGPMEGNEWNWKPFIISAITHPNFEVLREKYQVWIRITAEEKYQLRTHLRSFVKFHNFLLERPYRILQTILETYDDWSAIQDAHGACGFSSDLIIVTDSFKSDLSFSLGTFDRFIRKLPSQPKSASSQILQGERRSRMGSTTSPRLGSASNFGGGRGASGDRVATPRAAAAGRKSASVSPEALRPGKKRRSASGSGDAGARDEDSAPVTEDFYELMLQYISDKEEDEDDDDGDKDQPALGRNSGSGSGSAGSFGAPTTPPISGSSGSGSDLINMNVSPIRCSTPTGQEFIFESPRPEDFDFDFTDKENVCPPLPRELPPNRFEAMGQTELDEEIRCIFGSL